jgi:transposase
MQTPETTRRTYITRSRKNEILNELKTSGMTLTNLARKYGIHPVTIHKWKREMSQETKKDSIDVHEILAELEKLKEENSNLKKAVGELAITNQILQTANGVLKKSQRSEKLKSLKK